jgi:dTDP-4-dehydrorhamnose reductase
MTRLLVFGSGGQLGFELMRAELPDGLERTGLDRNALDVTDEEAVARAVRDYYPDVVVNAAAYTDVDGAEDDREVAFALNTHAPGRIAEICQDAGVAVIHFSTDYVFDGAKDGAYGEDDEARPASIYGQSKLEGETAVRTALDHHLIIRTSWMFGVQGQNFVKTILRLAAEKDRLLMVDDQISCPTAAKNLAWAVITVAGRIGDGTPWGTYNFAGEGAASWYDFAVAVLDSASTWLTKRPGVEPIIMADYPTPAPRPRNTVMDCNRIARKFAIEPAPWRDGLRDVVEELAERGEIK